jgi:hypothetical protein
MKMPLLLAVTTLLVASAARFVPAATLSASPNPVIAPAGQTEGATTLMWKTEGAEGFVRVSVGAGEETLLTDAGAIDGSLVVTAELGKTYVFKLYTVDKEKLLASPTVTVANQEAVPPPSTQLPPIVPAGPNVYPAYIYASPYTQPATTPAAHIKQRPASREAIGMAITAERFNRISNRRTM